MATATLENLQTLDVTASETASPDPRVIASGPSFDKFVRAPQFQGRRVERVAGEVVEKTSVSLTHSLLVIFLTKLLGLAAEVAGGRVMIDQF